MKVDTNTVLEMLSRLKGYFQKNYNYWNNGTDESFRSDIFNNEQMIDLAKKLAKSHKLSDKNVSDQLLKRLDDNEKTLLEVRNLLLEGLKTDKTITPAAEWLLDNFYFIAEQIVIARKHLPKGYSEGLPSLANGISIGLPRVYGIVLENISHSDAWVGMKSLMDFMSSYQSIATLTLGELWAIPIMLRLAVIENLRRLAMKVALDMIDNNLADYWALKLMDTLQEEPNDLIVTIADMAKSKPELNAPFVAGITRKLQGKGSALALPLSWIEQQLGRIGTNSMELIRSENQKQAARQVSIRNSIGTLHFLDTTDWHEFVEKLSTVEQVLRQDISETYPLMDFATRDRYRHVVESIAKSSSLSETEVAEKALQLSKADHPNNDQIYKTKHIGYYLIDAGRNKLEREVNMRYTWKQRLNSTIEKRPLFIYLSLIFLLTLIAAGGMFYLTYWHGIKKTILLAWIALTFLLGSAQLVISLINWISTLCVKPKLLPRMDFSSGIPSEYRSLVVIPTLLLSKGYIEEQLEALEIHFLANKEEHLHFGLLTDFKDAPTESLSGDHLLLQTASDKINALNLKYSPSDHDIFFLFHRARTWNPKEKKWMGYERKRGKLAALNKLIRGLGSNVFSVIIGRFDILTKVKYVITLDSDTQMPRDAAWKLIATMTHPLNQAVYNREKQRVTEGYGILQPRIASGIPKSEASLYLRMQGDIFGIDPYTQVSSDVYQDLFAEGSFIGKGIYDVDIFEKSVHKVFPDNRILSHDLVEGCYARAGLVSDILFYEQNPMQYEADIKRRHRWTRGDWQIAAWTLPFVTTRSGRMRRNKLSLLSKWKIFDNLRRSLLPQTLITMLLMGWTILPFPWLWTLTVSFIILLPVMAAALWQLLHKPIDLTLNAHLKEVATSVRNTLIRFIFGIAVLPYEAFVFTDAIIRANWRVMVSRKNLLEWTSSAAIAQHPHYKLLWVFYRSMWITPLLTVICIVLFLYINSSVFFVAFPILILWMLAPAISWYLNRPIKEESTTLSKDQSLFLHKVARKTWAFFEQFVTAEENWLPPDNYQEQPVERIAHRTSPTNIGMALLANLTAYDFGFISNGELINRSGSTLNTLFLLERFKGHFYNWYDTRSLEPLKPRYVSFVDSGNLLGHLLTLRQGLLGLVNEPIFRQRVYKGLHTTLAVLREYVGIDDMAKIDEMDSVLNAAMKVKATLATIKTNLSKLFVLVNKLNNLSVKDETAYKRWTSRLSIQIKYAIDDVRNQIPWLDLMPIPEKFIKLAEIDHIPSISSLIKMPEQLARFCDHFAGMENTVEENDWLNALQECIIRAAQQAKERRDLIHLLSDQCEQLSTVEYDFLFDKSTNLLRIGYNVEEQKKENTYYDLLASEARLGIFVAIAQGKIPQESWFALGRLLTHFGGEPILLSWSGSMFEYLMPQLVMPSYKNTLLYQTSRATVKRQIDYIRKRNTPWGISESAYNMVDADLNYQYRAFGVPGLGLKRGLEEDLVIAPYASMLALLMSPEKACNNLKLLENQGFEGELGFYEAIDYTPSRLSRDRKYSLIQSYMVHHQGMGLLSLAYTLLNKPMQERFVSELRFQATLLLLQERIPRATLFYAHTADLIETHAKVADVEIRHIATPHSTMPEIQLLSNGRYQVMITNAGGGYSRWNEIAITRWREDATRDHHGIFCYIKDVDTGFFWSNTYQPTLYPPKDYGAVFSHGHVEFKRHDQGIETKTEVIISPEDDTEMRRIRILNKTQSIRVLEITSYCEVVIASQASDESHPVFSNLFVQTEIVTKHKAIICTRRPRSVEEKSPWVFHLMDVKGVEIEEISYETDRMRFIGRGKTLVHPQAMDTKLLSGAQGDVLDPVMAIRYRIHIKPGQTATFDLIYGICDGNDACENLMRKYQDQHLKNRAFELFWTHNQVLLRQINATEGDAQLYDRIAASLIYANADLRADESVILKNVKGQPSLWNYSISGDLPIVLLRITDIGNIDLVRQMIQAHSYWQLKGLAVDLVIWNEDYGSYRNISHEQISALIPSSTKPGKVYIQAVDQISSQDHIFFESIARVIIYDDKGSLSEQINRRVPGIALPPLLQTKQKVMNSVAPPISLPTDLQCFNGMGGFSTAGNSYSFMVDRTKTTPLPWVNVLANSNFGTVISESGSAYTWFINAHEYRITPWNNDPISDVSGEAFYIRDEESGIFWSPSPFPAIAKTAYRVTHGLGFSTFECMEQGISSEMCVYVDKDLPIKFVTLKIKNNSERMRYLSATGFVEIILGDVRSKTNMHILSEFDSKSGALLFRNHYNAAFSDYVAFFKVNIPGFSFTTDRAEFIGRNKNLKDPQALYRKKLSGRRGAAMDPCAAIQTKFTLLEGEEREITFQLGAGIHINEVNELLQKLSDTSINARSLEEAKTYWHNITDTIKINTPDTATNILANGWLTYQTMASRLFARSGFYQSGGAYGFRDQLQDVLALLHTQPQLAREQILLSASRQFLEGDVQHWWHPPEGRGVRTRCSDDRLWLPYVVSRYIAVTGDMELLDVVVGFLDSRPLHIQEDSLYDLPVSGNGCGSLYEHCTKAIACSLDYGTHGLPLIGSGDWNDGMDRVGNRGMGESVWLAFFLYDVLRRFESIAKNRNDIMFAETCSRESSALQSAIETEGWDGEWYLRAYFDDGTPLGSKQNKDCRIDAIAQSWSVLSTAGLEDRKMKAMDALDKHLVNRKLKIIQLLTPAFDRSDEPNPGYIKGYIPGVRENGGQYTHAAIWSLMAFASLGNRKKTWELFDMLSPITHTLDLAAVDTYKVEPYVMAADVYANELNPGRGGWTWYTGSSGWMYQFIINSLLGLELSVNRLRFKPCFPLTWPSVNIAYKYHSTTYNITLLQSLDAPFSHWKIDDQQGEGDTILLIDDGLLHQVEVVINK
ncbi:GH36-type glycosyl hydrolase domain-containing protein [Sphingobacterium luzhongxinii]|uniref:GH36-type glycosyl hydrolase domain-containing protein n=1 Tax=Sphingobacterium luzhongxinii TaxID=2654181 RepID=UPI0013DC8EC8|nr:glucoamylase family protein [Sphingobacterium sp. xlx-73]